MPTGSSRHAWRRVNLRDIHSTLQDSISPSLPAVARSLEDALFVLQAPDKLFGLIGLHDLHNAGDARLLRFGCVYLIVAVHHVGRWVALGVIAFPHHLALFFVELVIIIFITIICS